MVPEALAGAGAQPAAHKALPAERLREPRMVRQPAGRHRERAGRRVPPEEGRHAHSPAEPQQAVRTRVAHTRVEEVVVAELPAAEPGPLPGQPLV